MEETILIIEDERGIVDSITYALKTEGFKPLWKTTGKEALELLAKESVTLILLDVGLPDINGFELFKKIKRMVNTPVIFLTARAEEIDRIVGLEMGADDYVTKPFSPRELTARIKAVLRRIQGKPVQDSPQQIKGFPFTCDEKKQVIQYFKKPLKISRYEYRILQVLIKHPGWVYSRQQLMEQAWDEPDVSLLRTVDTHIKNLRQKLKQINPEVDAIVTHHGSGYSLREEW